MPATASPFSAQGLAKVSSSLLFLLLCSELEVSFGVHLMPVSTLHPLFCQGRSNPEFPGELYLRQQQQMGGRLVKASDSPNTGTRYNYVEDFYDLYINMLESMPTGSNEIEAGIYPGVLWNCSSRKVAIGWQHCLLFSWSLKPGVLTTVRCNFTPCFSRMTL